MNALRMRRWKTMYTASTGRHASPDIASKAVFLLRSGRHGTASRTATGRVTLCRAGPRSVSLRRWKPDWPQRVYGGSDAPI
jgi:hypothetical protein